MSTKVFIVVKGGLVSEIHSDIRDIECVVIDQDFPLSPEHQQIIDEIGRSYYHDVMNAPSVEPDRSSISIKWHVDDVLGRAEEDGVDITEEEAMEILTWIENKHDANIGVNWDVISSFIDMYVHDRNEKGEANAQD